MVYSFELLLNIKYSDTNYDTIKHSNDILIKKRMKKAKELGIFFDKRSKMDVIRENTVNSNDAIPNFRPYMLVRDKINNNGLNGIEDTIFPLGAMSNKVQVGRNETGKWMVYTSDEYGFNNPPNSFKKNLDVFLIGDSYTEGESVANNENIASLLRQEKYDVYNCGMAGNGFLVAYAGLIEYASKIKPKNVFWIYSANDFADLNNELKSDLLLKYLNNSKFSQGLAYNQSAIDSVLKAYMNRRYNDFLKEKKNAKWSFLKFLKLTHTRNLIYKAKQNLYHNYKLIFKSNAETFFIKKNNIKDVDNSLMSNVKDIFIKSKDIIENWNGNLFFVYLPSGNNYLIGEDDPYKEYLMLLMNDLNIEFIDLTNDFLNHPNPLSLFPLQMLEVFVDWYCFSYFRGH